MYKTVSREVFIAYFADKKFNGNLARAVAEVCAIELQLGECEYAIPV
jgi:hypothetical protein